MAEEAKPAEAKPAARRAIRMAAINGMVEGMRYKGQIIARSNKYDSATMGSGLVGFAFGVLLSVIIILVPVVLLR
jgi:tetrahydromethanopterin S-methyltransferase subunit F